MTRQPLNLLVFNLAVDLDNPTVGFATRWIDAIARRVERVHVITMRMGRVEVPSNVTVRSVGQERGWSEARRALEFYRHLLAVCREDRIDACFSHMIQVFTVLAAPILRPRRVPIVTWYAHRAVGPMLKVAHHLSDRIVTSSEHGYRYRRDKLTILGHGIDTRVFAPGEAEPERPPLILSVGRLSPIKDLGTLIEACRLLRGSGEDFRCALVGDAPVGHEWYEAELRDRVAAAGLAGTVLFAGSTPNDRLASWYRRANMHVNLSHLGSLDKTVLETMASGCPSLVSNDAFRALLGEHAELLMFKEGDPFDLSQRLRTVLRMNSSERREVGEDLRRRIVERYGLDALADRLVDLLASLSQTNER